MDREKVILGLLGSIDLSVVEQGMAEEEARSILETLDNYKLNRLHAEAQLMAEILHSDSFRRDREIDERANQIRNDFAKTYEGDRLAKEYDEGLAIKFNENGMNIDDAFAASARDSSRVRVVFEISDELTKLFKKVVVGSRLENETGYEVPHGGSELTHEMNT